MPATSAKNTALSPAAQDLGLGDLLQQQLSDAEAERRKKLLAQAQGMTRGLGNSLNGMGAVSALGLGLNG